MLLVSIGCSSVQPGPGAVFGEQIAMAQPRPKHVEPSLIADTSAVVPGKPFKLGVKFKIEPGWHIYYKEAGEAGMPTRVDWTLPKGFTASDLLWEKPNKFSDAGIVTYGYHDETLIGATITPPANLKDGSKVTFTAQLKWLTCKDMCVPGDGKVTLTLPVSKNASATNESDFGKLGFTGSVSSIGGGDANGGSTNGSTGDVGAATAPPATTTTAQHVSISTPATTTAAAVATTTSTTTAVGTGSSFSGDVLTSNLKVQGQAFGGDGKQNLLAYLGFAFIGGFILNFMPCVLPVISIKVLSFMQQAGEHPERVFKLGLTFTAGIISSFLALAGLVIGIKAAGQNIGWGFQFQFPLFIFGMAAIVTLFALSLFGLFYVQVTTGQNEIDKLASKEGYTGTFFKGVLATTLSTPCSAPFLGPAIGFAFAQPAWTIGLFFLTIGAGMASPYVVLTAKPEWMKFLPKPGVWMEKFKESMGFLLLATVVWLIWTLAKQVGIDAAMAATGFLVLMSFAVWLVGRFTDLTSTAARKAVIYSLAGVTVISGYFAFLAQFPSLLSTNPAVADAAPSTSPVVKVSNTGEHIDWQPFTIASLNQQVGAGKTVFIDFTADWCLTCKVNESTVLNTPPVIDKLKALNAVTMRADWTRQDPTISSLLQKFGRSGVPLYVIFPAGKPTEPIVLPEVITQQIVIDKLAQAGPSHS